MACGRRVPLLTTAALLLIVLPLVSADADVAWTDDDENGGEIGYQEALIWDQGRGDVDGPDRTDTVAYVETTLVKVPDNAIEFRYWFPSDADPDDAVYMDVYQDESHTSANLSAETCLNFWVRGSLDSQNMQVGLLDSSYQESNLVWIDDWVEANQDISNSEYRAVTVLLSVLDKTGFSMGSVLAVTFTVDGENGDKGSTQSLYVDNIYFDGPLAVRWPR